LIIPICYPLGWHNFGLSPFSDTPILKNPHIKETWVVSSTRHDPQRAEEMRDIMHKKKHPKNISPNPSEYNYSKSLPLRYGLFAILYIYLGKLKSRMNQYNQ